MTILLQYTYVECVHNIILPTNVLKQHSARVTCCCNLNNAHSAYATFNTTAHQKDIFCESIALAYHYTQLSKFKIYLHVRCSVIESTTH